MTDPKRLIFYLLLPINIELINWLLWTPGFEDANIDQIADRGRLLKILCCLRGMPTESFNPNDRTCHLFKEGLTGSN